MVKLPKGLIWKAIGKPEKVKEEEEVVYPEEIKLIRTLPELEDRWKILIAQARADRLSWVDKDFVEDTITGLHYIAKMLGGIENKLKKVI